MSPASTGGSRPQPRGMPPAPGPAGACCPCLTVLFVVPVGLAGLAKRLPAAKGLAALRNIAAVCGCWDAVPVGRCQELNGDGRTPSPLRPQ